MDADGLPLVGPGVDYNKLSSIPGLEEVSAPVTAVAPTPPALVAPSIQPTPGQPAPVTVSSQPVSSNVVTPDVISNQADPPPAEKEVPKNLVSQDPRYAKYFKMIHLGVPPGAVKLKMSAEGCDPNLLDTPDAEAPSMPASKKEDSEEDSDNDGSDFSN